VEERVQRRLAAILAADVVGYSALMERAEEATYAQIGRLRREVIEPALARHQGRLIKTTGDGVLGEFASPVEAVRCGIEVQEQLAAAGFSIQLRIGINLGDVIVDHQGDVYGDGINIAARLESMADPGDILISGKVHSEVEGRVDVSFEDQGDRQLKNISKPVRTYAVCRNIDAQSQRHVKGSAARPLPLPDKPSIAVLPFQNISGDIEQEYFADGIVEDIITALSHFKALFVIARTSSFPYKGRAMDVKQVGRELGVRYVLEGSVRKAANRVRITGQLIDATTGAHLWADRFDGGLDDVFYLQDQITESVVGAIAPAIEKAEIERAKRKPTESLDAYALYLRGLTKYYQFANREANEEALRLFYRAIELDPDFAGAYGRAASCYATDKANGWFSGTANEIAEVSRLAYRAVELGENDAMALTDAGWALVFVVCDLEAGAALIDSALALNSNLALAWTSGGWTKLWLGEPDAAIGRLERAMRLDPAGRTRAGGIRTGIANAYFFLGRYAEAASWAAMALQDVPDGQPGLRISAASNAMAGQAEQAQKSVARLLQLYPRLRVSNLRDVLGPYRRPEDVLLYQEGLRRAGLPE
jgi:adenylate cyclase